SSAHRPSSSPCATCPSASVSPYSTQPVDVSLTPQAIVASVPVGACTTGAPMVRKFRGGSAVPCDATTGTSEVAAKPVVADRRKRRRVVDVTVLLLYRTPSGAQVTARTAAVVLKLAMPKGRHGAISA